MVISDDIESVLGHLNLKDVPPELVQYHEDDEYWYIDIGRNPEINRLWKESFDRIKAIEDKFDRAMLEILRELQAQEM